MQMDQPLRRPCPVCAEPNAFAFLAKNGLQLVRCVRCSMIYANPVAAGMASGAFYDQAGHEYLAADKLESDYAPVRFARELRLFRKYCRRGSVLDVGCSSGGFLYQLNLRHLNDYKILGTDVSGPPLDHAEKMGIQVIHENFLTHQFSEQFDAITFWAVMEHLFEPQMFLKKAALLLKADGLCFILVPNMKSLAFRLLGPKYRYIFAEHLNYFTPQTLRKFAEREFDVVKLISTHFNPIVIWRDYHDGGRQVPRAERAELLKRTTACKQSPWMLPARIAYRASQNILGAFNLGDNLVIIGRKTGGGG